MSRHLAFIGGGGHALSVYYALADKSIVAGYVDFDDTDFLPLPRIADDNCFLSEVSPTEYDIIITVGCNSDCSLNLRRKLIEKYKSYASPIIIAPTAFVAEDVSIADGTAILNRAVINGCTAVGRHCVVNTGAIVEHNCSIGHNVFIGPGAVICGGVEIGDNVFIGAGTLIKPGIKIKSDIITGIGTVVISDLTKPGTYVGNPSRKIK